MERLHSIHSYIYYFSPGGHIPATYWHSPPQVTHAYFIYPDRQYEHFFYWLSNFDLTGKIPGKSKKNRIFKNRTLSAGFEIMDLVRASLH